MQEYLAQALKLDIFLSGREFPVEDLNALRLSVMPRVAAIPAEELEWTKRALNEMMLCMQRLQGRRTSPDK
ncbi:MAG: hypothetical protein LBD42_07155 [Desulfovibrio sp.]|nr:hypothetical protein [Desulfovibrio sp.]